VIVGVSGWVEGSPLAMSAQVGTVHEGAQDGDELNCCVPPRQLDRPTTPGGRREGGGGVVSPGLHWRAVATQPFGGGRGGVGPGIHPAPYYPGPQAGGWGMGESGELEMTAHHECWLANTNVPNCITNFNYCSTSFHLLLLHSH
jgi:hypothetical protein